MSKEMQHSLIKKIGLSKEKDGLCESLEGEVYIVFFFFKAQISS